MLHDVVASNSSRPDFTLAVPMILRACGAASLRSPSNWSFVTRYLFLLVVTGSAASNPTPLIVNKPADNLSRGFRRGISCDKQMSAPNAYSSHNATLSKSFLGTGDSMIANSKPGFLYHQENQTTVIKHVLAQYNDAVVIHLCPMVLQVCRTMARYAILRHFYLKLETWLVSSSADTM